MNLALRSIIIALVAVGSFSRAIAGELPAGAFPQTQVLGYLEQLVQWQRDAAAFEPLDSGPREQIFQSAVRENAARALRAGFTFARAEASIAPAEIPQKTAAVDAPADTSSRRAERDAQLAALTAQLRMPLSPAQRKLLEGQRKILAAQQELFDTVEANFNAAASGGGLGFSAKIGNLQRSVPMMLDDAPASAAKKIASEVAATAPAVNEGTSVLSLAGRLFDIARKQRELGTLIAHTDQVADLGEAMLKTLHTELDLLTAADADAATLDARLSDVKQIAGIVPSLAETHVWVSTGQRALKDWNRSLSEAFTGALHQFGIRLAFLLATLAIPIVIGEVAERSIDRYFTDPKRQRAAHTVRRILVGAALVFTLLLNFISEFGSFATFAGFITAGLAVALQGVLLSLVAHFLFYGRYGVRVGDRVKVADVVGDIMQIGMVRFYLRELKENPQGELVHSGKVVAFPNSILFQPSAFYKYVG